MAHIRTYRVQFSSFNPLIVRMAKSKAKEIPVKAKTTLPVAKPTLSELMQNFNLWYKLQVLIYDLRNINSDHSSESRTLRTTDELYISGPYFTPSESNLIKATVVEETSDSKATVTDETSDSKSVPLIKESKTVEEAIKEMLAGFFDKRRASGDSRPCGPHDMAPIYEKVFNIKPSELRDERFLSRLRRSGLGESLPKEKDIHKETKKGKKCR